MALSPMDFGTPLSEDQPQEVSLDRNQIAEACQASLDVLAGTALPAVYKYPYPPVFLAVWDWLRGYVHKSRDFSQLALGLPRGFSKTTVIKLFMLYCVLFTTRKFILICSENQSKSENILADVWDMLQSPNILAVFGDWRFSIEKDTQNIKKFGFKGRTIVLYASTVPSVRGINLKHERPDVMIFDDIQSRTCAESQTESENLERELFNTAMKAKSPHGCLFIYVGNMHPTKWSILRHLKYNPTWTKFITGGILENGTSLWEDLQPLKQLIQEYRNDLAAGRPEAFFAEVLNDENASANSLIDLTKVPTYPFQDDDISAGSFIIIDPSGSKSTSDATAIGYAEVHDGKGCLLDCITRRMSPGETIEEALKMALARNCRVVAIESTAYQASLAYWFDFICRQRGIYGIEAVEIYPGAHSKNSRIISAIRAYAKGDFYIHPSVKALVHTQIQQFNPLKTNNVDDVLDLLVYIPKVLELFGHLVVAHSIIESQEFSRIEIPAFNTTF